MKDVVVRQAYPQVSKYTVLVGVPKTEEFKALSDQSSKPGPLPVPSSDPTWDDRRELVGTGTLVMIGGGSIHGVLTAGHVVKCIRARQESSPLSGGPYVRISGADTGAFSPGDSPRLLVEGTVVMRAAHMQTWGEYGNFHRTNWRPDLGFISLECGIEETPLPGLGLRCYPWEGRESRISRSGPNAVEAHRLVTGMVGERQRRAQRELVTLVMDEDLVRAVSPGNGYTVHEYPIGGNTNKVLVAMGPAATHGPPLRITTYQGMSGGAVWSAYLRPDRPEPNVATELHGVLFAQFSPGEDGVQSLYEVGTEHVKVFLEHVAQSVRDLRSRAIRA